MPDPLHRVTDAAAARGLDIELRERPAASSLAEAASLLGLEPEDIVKTLVVKRADDTYLFALIPGDLAISWPKLRAVVGVNKLRLPEPELALAATGYERGTIVPIGSTTDWPVYADASIVGRRIAMGAGAHGYSLFVDADDLIAAYSATVADISQPAAPPRFVDRVPARSGPPLSADRVPARSVGVPRSQPAPGFGTPAPRATQPPEGAR